MDVLILSRSYFPLGRTTWQSAFGMIFTGRAEVVEEYENREIRSASATYQMPSVIRFLSKASSVVRARGLKFNRRNVFYRDKGVCQYCSTKVSADEFTLDHVVPKSQGGQSSWENIVTACAKCNYRKANRTPEQAQMNLLCTPVCPKTPTARYFWYMPWYDQMPESWKVYLKRPKVA